MNSDNLRKALEANRFYYARIYEAMRPEREKIRIKQQQILYGIYQEAIGVAARLRVLETEFGHKYSPDQARVPAGNSDGGQWTSGGGGNSSSLGAGTLYAENTEQTTDAQIDSFDGHILKNPQDYMGQSFKNAKGNTECVAFAQQAGGAPLTRYWSGGDYISPQNPPPVGAWVATFEDGKYYGHVGAFYGYTDSGDLQLVDQFNSKKYVAITTYHVKPLGYQGSISNDPSKYQIVKW